MKSPVFLVYSEAMSAPEVAWSLVDAGYEVVACARTGRRSALRHSWRVKVTDVTPPELNSRAALEDLERLVTERARAGDQRGVVFPLDDAAVWVCSRMNLAPGWVLTGPRGAAADLALDKEKQVHAAQAAGLNVPPTTIARTRAEVRARSRELPLMLRPANAIRSDQGRLRKGRNWICATETELGTTLAAWDAAWPLMVQPFVQGVGEGVFGLATDEGVRAWSAHRRVRMMNPHGSGSSACVSQPVPDQVKSPVERLIAQMGWRGLFMVELLRGTSGTLWFVEFNGRPWGSMALSRRQGLEYPAWAVSCSLNEGTRVDGRVRGENHAICRNAGREFMHLLFVMRGPKSKALTVWPSFWRTALDLLRVRRGDSLYNWRRDDPKVFFSDCWYTIHDNLWKPKH